MNNPAVPIGGNATAQILKLPPEQPQRNGRLRRLTVGMPRMTKGGSLSRLLGSRKVAAKLFLHDIAAKY
jgi:hypothetical protein